MANLKNTTINDSGFVKLPTGTTSERPSNAETGYIRFNTTEGLIEYYNGQNWLNYNSLNYAQATSTAAANDIKVGNKTYKIHVFTGSGSITFSKPGEIEYLIVAGGGGGGSDNGGAGGAGGFVEGKTFVDTGSYTITVGSGGIGANGASGGTTREPQDGQDSSAFGITAIGGGHGASGGSNSQVVDNSASVGGSGGGGDGERNSSGANGTPGQGFAGGDAISGGGGAGGGGAGGPGDDETGNQGANGGVGKISSITGTPIYYAGGGGGGGNNSQNGGGNGGRGGGGNGRRSPADLEPGIRINGAENTGGGGGGGEYPSTGSPGGTGGSGIVIVRYETDESLKSQPQIVTSFQNSDLRYKMDASDIRCYYYGLRYHNTELHDMSGYGAIGELQNETGFSGDGGGSLTFDSSQDQHVTLARKVYGRHSTISIWWYEFNTVTGDDNGAGPIISGDNSSSVWIGGFTSGLSGETININDGNSVSAFTDTVQPGWHHVVWVYDDINENYRGFLDGTERSIVHRNDVGAKRLEDSIDVLGARINRNQYSDSKVAVVEIYENSLSNEAIVGLFERDRGRFGV